MKARYSKQDGLSLIELLISTVIGLALISGVVTVFAGNKRSSDLNTAMANIQENARFALDKIANDIRMSGFQGCVDINRSPANILAASSPTANFYETAAQASVIGAANAWTPSPALGFKTENHDALPGTHALTLQFGNPSTFPLTKVVGTGTIPNRTGPITVNISAGVSSRPFDLKKDDHAIISDCQFADIFKVSGVAKTPTTAVLDHSAPDNVSGALTTEYGSADTLSVTKLMRFVSNVYYVANTGIKNDHGDDIPALYQQSLPYGDITNNPPTELVRGIENLRISFGLRTQADTLTYVLPGDSRFDATQVETIRIGLLMVSYDPITSSNDANTYVLAGQEITPKTSGSNTSTSVHAADNRYRLAFNTTIKVRNRRSPDS